MGMPSACPRLRPLWRPRRPRLLVEVRARSQKRRHLPRLGGAPHGIVPAAPEPLNSLSREAARPTPGRGRSLLVASQKREWGQRRRGRRHGRGWGRRRLCRRTRVAAATRRRRGSLGPTTTTRRETGGGGGPRGGGASRRAWERARRRPDASSSAAPPDVPSFSRSRLITPGLRSSTAGPSSRRHPARIAALPAADSHRPQGGASRCRAAGLPAAPPPRPVAPSRLPAPRPPGLTPRLDPRASRVPDEASFSPSSTSDTPPLPLPASPRVPPPSPPRPHRPLVVSTRCHDSPQDLPFPTPWPSLSGAPRPMPGPGRGGGSRGPEALSRSRCPRSRGAAAGARGMGGCRGASGRWRGGALRAPGVHRWGRGRRRRGAGGRAGEQAPPGHREKGTTGPPQRRSRHAEFRPSGPWPGPSRLRSHGRRRRRCPRPDSRCPRQDRPPLRRCHRLPSPTAGRHHRPRPSAPLSPTPRRAPRSPDRRPGLYFPSPRLSLSRSPTSIPSPPLTPSSEPG